MKSAWAYKNGKRIMKESTPEIPKYGFIELHNGFVKAYAEKTEYGLMVKTYANEKQVDEKVRKLREAGLDVSRTLKHPYLIIQN